MLLELNDEVVQAAGLSLDEVLLELAIHLVETKKLTPGQARRLTSLPRLSFEAALAERGLWPSYEEADLQRELDSLRAAGLL